MPQLSQGEVRGHAAGTGLSGDPLETAVAIAGWEGSPSPGESHGRTDAVGDVGLTTGVWGPSVGLWQIRSLQAERGSGRSRDELALQDPDFNARSMYAISNAGTNWSPWTVYRNGAHLRNLKAQKVTNGSNSDGGVLSGAVGLARTLTSPDWWRRLGWGALGAALAALGLVVLFVTSSRARAAVRTAGAVATKGAVG